MRKWMVAWTGACLLCLPLMPALAGDDENLREQQQGERRVKELMAHAAELEADGQHDKAAEYRAKAKELFAHIKGAQKKTKKQRAKKHKRGGDLINTLEGLEQGIAALRKLGKKEEAAHLQEIAKGVRRRIEGGKKQKQRGMGERELVKNHIETLRIAMHGFQEAEKREWAEQIEHAIHARELGLEGRRDEEAIHIRKTAPSDGHLAELLHVAAKYYSEWGHPDRAERVAKLSAWFGHRWNDQKARKKGGEREVRREHEARREYDTRREHDRERAEKRRHAEERQHRERRGPDDRMQAAMERIERLEERLNKVLKMLEKMSKERRK